MYVAMDLASFLTHLHGSCYSTFRLLTSHLDNSTLKCLRLSVRSLTDPLFPFLFRRIYVSAHDTDLEVFRLVASNVRACQLVTEIVWDDTTFDRWISGQGTYQDRLLQVTPLTTYMIQDRDGKDVLNDAYRFWASEATSFGENRAEDVDRKILEENISAFPNLRHITVMGRSRLTYVDPRAYWEVFQTPRSRAWRAKLFHRFLIQPEPFKPSIGTTVPQSEGIRPMKVLLEMARNIPEQFKIGALSINVIGGGQSRATGSTMNNGNRFDRRWHIDLEEVTADRSVKLERGKVVLNLLIEMQTEDIFKQCSLWEELLEQATEAGKDTIEEITISNICVDWFYEYQIARPQRLLESCRRLRRMTLIGGWCQDPFSFLGWLKVATPVSEVDVLGMDLESISWLQVLQDLKMNKAEFDRFEIRKSRCPSDFYPVHADKATAAPWSGSSDDVVAWLRGERNEFPLSQGPG